MEFYEASAAAAAPSATLWEILTDTEGYTDWDNGVVRVEGTIAEGNKIKVFSEVSPDRAFPVKVAFPQPGVVMTWSGGMPLGLFKGVRTFSLEGDGDKTTFHLREEFTGPLLGMIFKRMPELQPSFDQFAAGLVAEAERRASS